MAEATAGFAISTSDEGIVEENLREAVADRRFMPRAYRGWKRSGYIGPDDDLTGTGWNLLVADIRWMETNAMKWIRERFDGAREEGHDRNGDLVGTFWYDDEQPTQVELVERGTEECIPLSDLHAGAYGAVSSSGQAVLESRVCFFGLGAQTVADPRLAWRMRRRRERGLFPL